MRTTLEAPRTYKVIARDREPLVEFMVHALEQAGCRILHRPSADRAPFRITFETPEGERIGIVAYAFLANTKITRKGRNEHRFHVKYGPNDGESHEVWQDPYGLYVTLFVGINPDGGFFVGADPVLHNPTRFFMSVEFKEEQVSAIRRDGWFAWEREHRGGEADCEPVEILVGGRQEEFLRFIRFEREALCEDQGHRHLLAEQFAPGRQRLRKGPGHE